MATLTPTSITTAGHNDAGVAAEAGGDEFVNTGYELLRVTNGGGSSITVTITTEATLDGNALADLAVTVPAGESRLLGPFAAGIYNDADSKVQIAYSAVTSVTVFVPQIVPLTKNAATVAGLPTS